jgi:Fe-S cluster assembly ATPase SufC
VGKVEELMQRNIEEKFSEKESREIFQHFEMKYNSKILDKINKFSPDVLDSNDVFNTLFKNVGEKAKENSKLYSKLKHE